MIYKYIKKGEYMFENVYVEQFIETTNPLTGGAFGIVTATSGFDNETKFQIKNDARIISSLIRGNYDAITISDRVLKPTAKPNLFGKFKDKDYELKERMVRSKIEIIDESQIGPLQLREDYRNTPEKAPFKLAKTKLGDGRTVVLRVSGIGTVYSDLDTRSGNYFCHGIIFPAGVEPTNEQIKQIDFEKGLSPNEWNKENFKFPKLSKTVPIKQSTYNSQKKPAKQMPVNLPPSPKNTLPSLVFTRAQQITEWKKRRAEIFQNQEQNLVEYEIQELNEKIQRADSYIKEQLSKVDLDDIIKNVALRQDKILTDAQIKALDDKTIYDENSVKKSDEFRATKYIEAMGKAIYADYSAR